MTRPKKNLRFGVGAVVPERAERCRARPSARRDRQGALDERQARLDNWITDWRCSDPWLVQVARATEESWREDAILRRHRHWQREVSWWRVGIEIPAPRFDSRSETVESCLDRARAYAVTVLAQAKESGLVNATIKRAREHFD